MTRVGDISTNQDTVVVDIGTGVIVQQGGVMYTDKELNSNTDYYIFIRVFSSINGSVCLDVHVYVYLNAQCNAPYHCSVRCVYIYILYVYVIARTLVIFGIYFTSCRYSGG